MAAKERVSAEEAREILIAEEQERGKKVQSEVQEILQKYNYTMDSVIRIGPGTQIDKQIVFIPISQ